MCTGWDRRLAGIIEVSDRGPDRSPRYAVIDGQHRWAAAQQLPEVPLLVANVHEGLDTAAEAALFDKLNRQRRQPTTWDHWRARKAAADPAVLAIDAAVNETGLQVAEKVKDGHVWCISTLERIAATPAGTDLLRATLNIIHKAWGEQRTAYEAPIVGGMALIIHQFDEKLDGTQLIDALMTVPPARIRSQAVMARESGTPGPLAKHAAIAILGQYNRRATRRLALPARWAGSLPKAKA
jgi:hypothetical protein